MNCYLCGKKNSYYVEYFDNKERYICRDCFEKLNEIKSPYKQKLFYRLLFIAISSEKRDTLFDINIFSYKDLRISSKHRLNKTKFNATYLYNFRIGV